MLISTIVMLFLTISGVYIYTLFMRRVILWAVVGIFVISYFYIGIRYSSVLLNFAVITFDEARIIIDILRSLVETMAIVIAGFWTYERFIKSREEYPYPKIQHRVECYKVKLANADLIYLSVFANLTNEGKNKIDKINGIIYIEQVFPLSEKIQSMLKVKIDEAKDDDIRRGKDKDLFLASGRRLNFEALGEREWCHEFLEPGQSVIIQFDFLIEDNVEVVSILNRYKYGILKSNTDFVTLHSLKPENIPINYP